MRSNRQAPYLFPIPGCVSGASGAQATIVLLVMVFMLVLMVKSTVGDAIITAANDFAQFRVWGAENSLDNAESNIPPGSDTTLAYDASVVSIELPARMTQGDRSTATITMKNTGIANWYADGDSTVQLGAVGGSSRDAYHFSQKTTVPMASGTIVRRGELYAFTFNIVAPVPRMYQPEFQMTGNEPGGFGEIASKSINVVPIPTPTHTPTPVPTAAPTPTPTYPPYETYVAYGKFILYDSYGHQMIGGPWNWAYDGPFGPHNLRSSYFSELSWPYPDWDIGGPNGQYRIYKDGCTGSLSFSMNNGGEKGTITFKFNN